MSPEDTGKAYDTITHLWTREQFNSQNGIAAYEKALSFLVPHQGPAFALDVGCGCTNRFIPLIEKANLQYEGIDISATMLSIANESYPSGTFYHEDVCAFELPKTYTFISAWDSFWHIPLEQQQPLLEKFCDNLVEDGVLLFSCGGVKKAGSHTNTTMGPEVYYASLGLNAYLSILIKAGCIIRHVEFDQYPEKHTVVIAQKDGA